MTSHSPRGSFDLSLQALLDEVLVLGSMVEQAVAEAVEALRRRDLDTSKRIIREDVRINQKRNELENSVLILIATQQPMARDLRLLAAVLEIITELERIGDYAKGISKINLMIGRTHVIQPPPEIFQMTEQTSDMLHRALTAFVNRDVSTARQIPANDDTVDALYEKVFRHLVDVMASSLGDITQANYLLWTAHNLERMGDRVINICERIVFAATGEMMEMEPSSEKGAG